MTLLTMWTVLCLPFHKQQKWVIANDDLKSQTHIHKKGMEFDRSGHTAWGQEAYSSSHSCLHAHTFYSWGAPILQRPVNLGDCGISIVRFVLVRSVWGNSSMCSVFSSAHICLSRGVDMMYEAVCQGWAKKNGALHHLASHCQTQPRHYTSQKYQAYPRLSNFAICWQCLHGGWFVITNSRAKINKLIYDPSCICTMKMPLVM